MVPTIFPDSTVKDESLIKKILKRLDWGLIICVLALVTTGFFAIYSAAGRYGNAWDFCDKQFVAFGVGFFGMLLLIFISYQIFNTYSYYIYAITVLLLLGVLFFGVSIRGARAWFDVKVFYFQPAELTKLGLIIALAGYIDKHSKLIKQFRGWIVPLLLAIVHVVLILLQPDFSTLIVIFPLVLVMLYVAGARWIQLNALVLLGSLMLGIPLFSTYLNMTIQHSKQKIPKLILWMQDALAGTVETIQLLVILCILLVSIWWFFRRWRVYIPSFYLLCTVAIIFAGIGGSVVLKKGLKEYQRQRLVAFINPELDPLGAGYNILQSRIAVGSGGFFGKGYLSGTQSQLGFLPEQHTDFIFSVIAEEMGFLRALLLLGIYLWVVWRAIGVATTARDRFGKLVATGIATMFAFYGVINVGMTMGMMPITGLPLPFVSYGGSSLVSSLFAVGLLQSIHIRRFVL